MAKTKRPEKGTKKSNKKVLTDSKIKAINKIKKSDGIPFLNHSGKVLAVGDNDRLVTRGKRKLKNVGKETSRYSYMPPYLSRREEVKFSSKAKPKKTKNSNAGKKTGKVFKGGSGLRAGGRLGGGGAMNWSTK